MRKKERLELINETISKIQSLVKEDSEEQFQFLVQELNKYVEEYYLKLKLLIDHIEKEEGRKVIFKKPSWFLED